MLPPDDTNVIARDIALPGLRLVLDAEALTAEMNLPPMQPLYLRYKPGTSCVAALAPKDGGLGAVAVMAYTPERYTEVRDRKEWTDGPTPAVFHDAACLAVVPIARDRALKGARIIADAQRGPALLSKLTGDADVSARCLLRYKVGRRLVLQVGGGDRAALVKAYNKNDFAKALEGARVAQSLGGVPLAGVSSRHQCLAWRWMEGDPLCPQAGGSCQFSEWRSVGQALARVHAASINVQAKICRSDERAELVALSTALPLHCLDVAQKAAPLIRAVIAGLEQIQVSPVLIHGDFSADQVLMHDGKVTILDWDRAAMGDPARDIGSILARLDIQRLDGLPVAGLAEAFCEGYAKAGGPAKESITLQHARALLVLTLESFRQRHPDWVERARLLLERVEDILAPHLPCKDPAMPALQLAMSPTVMTPLIQQHLAQDIRHIKAELCRHKPGRRALLRYCIETSDQRFTLLGKMRAKGPDTKTPALHTQLRAHKMDGSAPHYVGVPAARGVISEPALWLQDEVEGRQLTSYLYPGADTSPVTRTGAALARLHTAAVSVERHWTMDNERDVLTKALSTARMALPEYAQQIDDITAAAEALIRALEPPRIVGIHRDFYPDQVMINDETVWLLDLDLYVMGDPTIDVANFLAHLDEHGLRYHNDPDALAPQRASFTRAYDAILPGVDLHRVEVLRMISLARHINLSRVIPGRGHTTVSLIDLCLKYINDLCVGRSLDGR